MGSHGRRGTPESGGPASVSQEPKLPSNVPCTQLLAGPTAPLGAGVQEHFTVQNRIIDNIWDF